MYSLLGYKTFIVFLKGKEASVPIYVLYAYSDNNNNSNNHNNDNNNLPQCLSEGESFTKSPWKRKILLSKNSDESNTFVTVDKQDHLDI